MKSRSVTKAVGIFCFQYPGKDSIAVIKSIAFFCALSLLILSSQIKAQTTVRLSGYVYDAFDGSPLVRATVTVLGTNFSSRTDLSGFFLFENLPLGRYRLMAGAEGYESQSSDDVEAVTDITRQVDFRLKRKVHYLGEKEVRGKRAPLTIHAEEVITRKDIKAAQTNDLADILGKLEGVYVQQSGSSTGPVQISIRGCDPKHVLVLLDGQRLNSSATGVADLSTIPLNAVEKIEVYRGGESARFGTDALGGVVNIITHLQKSDNVPELMAKKYWGKWKTNLSDLALTNFIPIRNLNSRLVGNLRSTNGDFDYNYAVSPATQNYVGTRKNADLISHNYFASSRYQFSPLTSVSFSGQYYNSIEGLPGPVSGPDTVASKQDKRILGSLIFQFDDSFRRKTELSVGFNRFEQHFDNSDDIRNGKRYESRYINDVFNLEATNRYYLGRANEIGAGISLQRDILYHDNLYNPKGSMGRTVRDNMGLFMWDKQNLNLDKLPFGRLLSIDFSFRWDNTRIRRDSSSATYNDRDAYWSQRIGLTFTQGTETQLILRSSYGTSYKLPSINALFWKEGALSEGNPQLRPERAEHSDVGLEIQSRILTITISGGITYFHSYIKDLIMWQPSSPSGAWKPVNLNAALLTGHEEFVCLAFWNDHVQINYRNTIVSPRNRTTGPNSYDKYLTYRPHYVTNIEAIVECWKFRGTYNVRLVDVRYTNGANTKWYDAYRIDDGALTFKTILSGLDIETSYRVKNFSNEHYVLIGKYPMPGREWGVDVSITYRMKQ